MDWHLRKTNASLNLKFSNVEHVFLLMKTGKGFFELRCFFLMFITIKKSLCFFLTYVVRCTFCQLGKRTDFSKPKTHKLIFFTKKPAIYIYTMYIMYIYLKFLISEWQRVLVQICDRPLIPWYVHSRETRSWRIFRILNSRAHGLMFLLGMVPPGSNNHKG